MTDDSAVKNVPANPCCKVWKERYSKLQHRYTKLEDGRTALRQGIEIFDRQIAKMQSESLNLKEAYEQERVRADSEREEKMRELALRVSLENEISALKSERFSLQQNEGSGAEDVAEEVTLLRAHVSDGETEINRLKELLEKERTRADSEKKKANEAWEIVKAEKSRADGVQADNEREEKMKESALRVSLENEISALKSEIFSLRQNGGSGSQDVAVGVTLLQACISERDTEINLLKEHLEKERTIADSEKQKAEAEKRKANEAWEITKAEKSGAERVQTDNEREEIIKESALRVSLENEISALKSEILSLQQRGGSGAQDVHKEVTLLRSCISEGETEINELKELLEKERTRADSEKKKASEAWEIVKAEKSRSERVQTDDEREEKAKEAALRASLENEISALKSEIFSVQQKGGSGAQGGDEEVTLLQVRVSEGETEINRLKEFLEKEKTRAGSLKRKAEAEKKKACEALEIVKAEKSRAERVQTENERDEKAKEAALRLSLENEISALKSEIFSLQQKGVSGAEVVDSEVTLLQVRISEGETEINRLKELLEKERTRAGSEKKKAEAEKKKANEAWKILTAEKIRADEERRLAGIEGKKAKEDRLQLERLKIKADEAMSKLVLETLKSEEANKKLEMERQKVIKEKVRADSEIAKAEEQRKLAEIIRRKAAEEKFRADHLSQQLEEDRQRIEKLQKEIDELGSSRKLVEAPADIPVKQMNAQTAKLKGGFQLKTLQGEADESKLDLECLKSGEANKKLPEVKQKAKRERKHADLEMKKAEEHIKVAEAYREKTMEENSLADHLARQLEDNRRRTEELHKEVQELVSFRTLVDPPVVPPDENMNVETARVKLLRKQLKLEKMQVKHVKQVAKLEKGRNHILRQELYSLKQDFVQFSHRLDILDDCFSHRSVGTDDLAKTGNVSNTQRLNLKRKLLGIDPYHMQLQSRNKLLKPSCTAMDSSDCLKENI